MAMNIDAQTYAEELGMKLELQYPLPSGSTDKVESIEGKKIGPWVKEVVLNKCCENIRYGILGPMGEQCVLQSHYTKSQY